MVLCIYHNLPKCVFFPPYSFFNGTWISFPYIVVAHLSNSNNDRDNGTASAENDLTRIHQGTPPVRNLQGLETSHQGRSKNEPFFPCNANLSLWRKRRRTCEKCWAWIRQITSCVSLHGNTMHGGFWSGILFFFLCRKALRFDKSTQLWLHGHKEAIY